MGLHALAEGEDAEGELQGRRDVLYEAHPRERICDSPPRRREAGEPR